VPGAMRPQTVPSAKRNIGNVIMEHIAGAAAQSLTANLPIMVEHAEFNRGRVC
jgi:hypothetical protein